METLEETELCFPLINSSCRKPVRRQFEAMLIYVVLSFIAVVTATLNLLVIISISHFKKLHTPTNLILLSLAATDFLVGLLMFFQIVLIYGCWFLGAFMCSFYTLLGYITTSASIGTMVLISIDRYIAICNPLHYSSDITLRGVTIYICLCWVISVLYNGVMLRDNLKQPDRHISCHGECMVAIGYVWRFVDVFFSFIGPVTVIVVLYLRVFVVAVSQARAMHSHVAAVTLDCSEKLFAKKSEMKAARTLSVVIVIFLLCLCPYFGFTLQGRDRLAVSPSYAIVVTCLFYFNSCLNPLVYAFFYPWFRKSVKLIVTCQILRTDSSQANIL